jgi:hypothetical protein
MILSGYNKFLFSIISEKNDYLILTVYVLKLGKRYISFLQIHYSKIDSSGKYLPSFVYRTRLSIIDSSDRDIVFSKGRIIFKEDSVKVEFSSDLVMLYLNYSWNQNVTGPLTVLGKEVTGKDVLTWNSFDFRSFVKGSMITPNNSVDFTDVPGNIDLVKTSRLRFKIPVSRLIWSRLHHQDIDLSYSSVFDRSKKSDSKLFLSIDKKVIEFSDVNYSGCNDKVSSRSSVKYPNNILLTAKNDNYQVSVSIYDHSEVNVNEMVNNIDLTGKLLTSLYTRIYGNPKELRLQAKADIILSNNNTRTEIHNISSIGEYITFSC